MISSKNKKAEILEAYFELLDELNELKKETNFSKYGIPITHPRYNAVARYFDDPKPFRFGFDLKTAGGWTLAQMDRAATQGDCLIQIKL